MHDNHCGAGASLVNFSSCYTAEDKRISILIDVVSMILFLYFITIEVFIYFCFLLNGVPCNKFGDVTMLLRFLITQLLMSPHVLYTCIWQ